MSLLLLLAAAALAYVFVRLGLDDCRSGPRTLALVLLAIGLTAFLLICGPPWAIDVARWIAFGAMVAQLALPLLLLLLYPLYRDPDDEW